jgi:hypothetical protein
MSATWAASRARTILPACLLALLAACQGTRNVMDPILEIRTPGGAELGVSTDYGVLFLGRTARSGEVNVVAWFGDGPSQEISVIEPLGDGLYTAQTQIRLPAIPITFRTPRPGDAVLIAGRRGADTWEAGAVVLADARVEGILLSIPAELADAPDQVGAGIFVDDPETGHRRLVAMVSGVLELTDPDGVAQRYLTAVGPEQIWRLVTRRQDLLQRRRWIYREDVL